MSTFTGMSEQSIKNLISKIFTKLEEETDQMAYVIVCPEDWTYLKTLTDFIDFATNKHFFEKGYCGDIWGAQIWINKKATETSFYTENQKDILDNEQPLELIEAIEEFENESDRQ